MKEKKETTAGVNPGVVNPEENATAVNKVEVVGAEVVNTDTAKPEENTTTVKNTGVVWSDSAKPEENNTGQDVKTDTRVLGVKVITDEDNIETQEASILEPFSFISESGEEYQITVPKFRFKGQEYDSQKAIDETPEVLEILIEAKSFIIKKA